LRYGFIGGITHLQRHLQVDTVNFPIHEGIFEGIQIYPRAGHSPRWIAKLLSHGVKRDSIKLVRSIYRANRNTDKRQYLEEFLDNFEILKLEVRLCADLKLISIRSLAELSKMLEIIGKQATAWKNRYN
jgi:hypothetical protein